MSVLNLTNDEVFQALGHLLGISRDSTLWDATTFSDVNRIIRSGRRRFFSVNNWKFLNTDLVINTAPPISSSTITVVSGVVTLAAGIWPSDAIDYVLSPSSGGVYTIASRDSDTQLTLHDTSLNLDPLSTYTIYKTHYNLPSNFGSWEGPITVGNNNVVRESRNFPEYLVRSIANTRRLRIGRPELFAVSSNTDSGDIGIPTFKLQIYPLPDIVYTMSSRYKIAPGDGLDLDTGVANTHAIFSEAMLEAILAAAEVIAFDKAGVHAERFEQLAAEAINIDNRMYGTRLGAPRSASRFVDKNRQLIDAPVSFE